jgi:hypothetical protein
LIAAWTSKLNTATNTIAVAVSISSDRSKIERAGVDAGEKILVGHLPGRDFQEL